MGNRVKGRARGNSRARGSNQAWIDGIYSAIVGLALVIAFLAAQGNFA